MADRLPAVHFLLAGGRDADVERVRGESAGLDNITLAGFIPNAALPTYQAACEVLLMPYGEKISASSGGDIAPYLSPMKLFESLASGRAVLSSDLPVLRVVLDESNAVLLPPGDIEAWADAVGAHESDPARRKRLGEAGRSAASRYSWRARAERILAGLG
jgi:glycosyltransferase involved in cell wall biosynthesis